MENKELLLETISKTYSVIEECKNKLADTEKQLNILRELYFMKEKDELNEKIGGNAGEFIKEKCIVISSGKVKAKDLYESYIYYIRSNGIMDKVSRQEFYSTIRELGYLVKNGSKNILTIYGISLKQKSKEVSNE